MTKKRFSIYADAEELKTIKQNAEKQKRSMNKYILQSAIETPNLATGNWWNNPSTIRKIAQEMKKELK